jgi:hypothetical protein
MRKNLAHGEPMREESPMPSPLDSLSLPKNATALRTLLLAREAEHAAELEAARNGLKDQALQIEQLKARLAKLLRQRFGSSSEKLRGQIDQLHLLIGDLEEEYAETTPPEPEPEPSAIEPETQPGGANPNANRCRKTCRAMWWSTRPPVPARNAVARCAGWART